MNSPKPAQKYLPRHRFRRFLGIGFKEEIAEQAVHLQSPGGGL
jgi:hypothetical protein